MDLMLDLETMGTEMDAVIVQIGACYFERSFGHILGEFLINVDMNSCIDWGLSISPSTVWWWKKQSKEAQDALKTPEPVKLEDAVEAFRAFTQENDSGHNCFLWCHPNFDEPILKNAFNACGTNFPFKYYAVRDVRTAVDLSGIDISEVVQNGTHHNALDDCKYQARLVSESFKIINNK